MSRGVLFLCVANSARSQMAEGLARRLCRGHFRVQSAGSQPSSVHPLAIRVMEEVGIDITGHQSKSVEAIEPQSVDTVITLCTDEVCPTFLNQADRLHWPLPDPADTNENEEDQLRRFREIREEISKRLLRFFDIKELDGTKSIDSSAAHFRPR